MADEAGKTAIGGEGQTAPDLEGQARKQGWRPKEEFAGNPDDWVDAGEFLERGKSWAPIMSAKNRELEKTLREMRTVLRQQMDMNHKRAVTVRQQHEENIKQLQTKISTLEGQLAKSITDNDAEGAVRASREIRKTEEAIHEGKAAIGEADKEVSEIGNRWKAVNPWYGDDREATEYADFIGFTAGQRGLGPYEVLEAIDVKVREKFPDLFPEEEEGEPVVHKPATKRQVRRSVTTTKTDDDAGTGGTVKWADLTSEEQGIAAATMKKAGLTKEQYLKQLGSVM